MRRLLTSFFVTVAVLLVGAAACYVYLNRYVYSLADPYIYSSVADIPANRTAMVLGAQVLPGDEPSLALADRLATAVQLYKAGKATQLLMSGDGRSPYYNEVQTMGLYAKDKGVPASAVLSDPSGLRTYSSCYRARNEYGITKMTIVTQPDHLRRAVYTCRSLGIDAIGIEAPDIPVSGEAGYVSYKLREKAALVLAWIDVEFIRPTS